MTAQLYLTDDQWVEVAREVKFLLHASRDSLRNRYMGFQRDEAEFREGRAGPPKAESDPRVVRFSCVESHYCEAYGVLRGLAVLGYGTVSGAVNLPEERRNFRWWLKKLEDEVLAEEGFGGDGVCEDCMGRYRKDDSSL
jgi:hypothetical protein